MSYRGGVNYECAFKMAYGIFFVSMLLLGIYLIDFKKRIPNPPNNKAFGCYITDQSAPILLNKEGMTILQSPPMQIGYHLENHKTGIALTADAPITAQPNDSRYTYSIERRGVGWYLDFFNEIGGRRYGVFDENELQQFTMLATDGRYLSYHKGSPTDCKI